jgi:glycosyltransferase involved in cell wall biosynthesis
MVLSFHDHYFICPTIHLLDQDGRYCAGECTPGPGVCPTVRAGTLPVLKHSFVYQWREDVDAVLRNVDAFSAPSEYTRDIHRRFLAAARRRRFDLIEHGRDLSQHRGLAVAPQPGGRVRILVPGNLDRHKGAALLEAICRLDRGQRLELHFLGDVPASHRHLGVIHGTYERDQFADRVREIRPAFIGVFSSTGESYSFAVTEAWGAGVPVLATDLGAQAQRVRTHGGGFVISSDDPAAALDQVLAAADDSAGYAREAARADAQGLPGVADMVARYAELYRDVLTRRRTLPALEGIGCAG